MNIEMDLTSSLTILMTIATFLGFWWQISARNKKHEDAEEEKCADTVDVIGDAKVAIDEANVAIQELKDDDQKIKDHLEKLDEKINEYSVELEKLHELTQMFKEENSRLRQEFLDNLDRIEKRLEKMIDLILRIKRDD